MYVWILHCVLRTFEYLKIRVLISGTLPKTPDWRKFRHHVERCALLGLDRLELRRLRADLIYSLLQDYTRSGFVVARQFFFTFVCNSKTRGHSFKLFLPDSRVNCRQHFFAVRGSENLELAT